MPVGHLHQNLGLLADALFTVADWAASSARRKLRVKLAGPNGRVSRPGADTPLWNELAKSVHGEFRRRGDKARLARVLGVTRQRLHLLLVAKTACPDAEQTLLLLAWLATHRHQAKLQRR
jgi:hypothetical protein